jgi:hypothetical protein
VRPNIFGFRLNSPHLEAENRTLPLENSAQVSLNYLSKRERKVLNSWERNLKTLVG